MIGGLYLAFWGVPYLEFVALVEGWCADFAGCALGWAYETDFLNLLTQNPAKCSNLSKNKHCKIFLKNIDF